MSNDTRERAMRAQAKARKLVYTSWQPFVRMISRNRKMEVIPSAVLSATDGKNKTYIKVPIELGDDTPHDKVVCGERDEHDIMKCAACKIQDEVSYKIFHECAHNVYKSFVQMSDADLRNLAFEAIRISADGKPDTSRAAKLKARVERESKFVDSYIAACKLISPFMLPVVNAVEDAYVNAMTIEARPGLAGMYSGYVHNVFLNGSQELDGKVHHWRDRPLNDQASISILCAGTAGLDFTDWLHPKVIEAINSPEIAALIEEILPSDTSRKRYFLSMRLLEAFRKHGFFIDPDDPEDDPEPNEDEEGEGEPGEGGQGQASSPPPPSGEEEDDDESSGGGGGGESEDEESDDDADPDDTDGEGDDEPDDDSTDDDGEGDEPEPPMGDADSTEQSFKEFSGHADDDKPPTAEERQAQAEMEKALAQGEHFEAPSREISGLLVVKPHEGHAFSTGDGTLELVGPGVLGPALQKGRLAFTANKKGATQRNLERGHRLDSRVLARRIPVDDMRVFRSRTRPGKRNYFVCVGLDVSGSTGIHKCNLIKTCGAAQGELLHRLGVRFSMYAHTGDDRVLIHEVKGPTEPWGDTAKRNLGRLGRYAANLDGHTLEFYRKVLDAQPESEKVILYYTDGAMPAENYSEELEILQREIAICRQRGYVLLGVGVNTSSPEAHGLETVRLDSAGDIGRVLDRLRSKLN